MRIPKSLVSLLVAALASACNVAPNTAGQISDRIGEVANDPSSREVDLAKLTTFGWDRMHVFKAGTTREDICRFLNANRNSCGRVIRYESVPAEHLAILFTLGYQLTHAELHSMANGEFDVVPGPDGWAKSNCVFRIRHVASTGPKPVAHLEPR